MPVSKLDRIKSEFKQHIEKSFELISSVEKVNKEKLCFSQDQIYLVYELSFIRIFLAWEQFLEDSFVSYMVGSKTDSGYGPKTYVTPRDEEHVYDFIKEGRDYVDWLTPGNVIRKANLFFENGEPYKDSLHPIVQVLKDMKTVRNAIVHMSIKAQKSFESLVRGGKVGYVPNGTTPGKFLSEFINQSSNKTNITYFKEQLETTSDKIIR